MTIHIRSFGAPKLTEDVDELTMAGECGWSKVDMFAHIRLPNKVKKYADERSHPWRE